MTSIRLPGRKNAFDSGHFWFGESEVYQRAFHGCQLARGDEDFPHQNVAHGIKGQQMVEDVDH